ncbi:alpha/beta hydrolase family protein [Pseudomarimonas salicorniae]|uniref:Alpha/beta hydrolase n=1 Tax=Pseudomarimonas salicorniae TaxID=2933270 RepID=A0ABT0GI02_9GAMM|nr:alpha/beta fold hydrolase [Lysobacter sp. CAU 1642]MCK7594058.1 alpha/beta hydrolase [Lysobacter sp. CAU 1642]
MSQRPVDLPSASFEIDLGPGRTAVQAFDADGQAPCLMLVPALGVPARHYHRLGAALAGEGVNAMVLDLRGVGSSSLRARRGVDWGYLDLVDAELNILFRLAGERWPGQARHWLGHSLGGQLCLLHQARHPEHRAGSVVLAASGAPWVRTFAPPMRWLVGLFAWLVAASTRRLGVFRGDWFRFGGPQGARLMLEWARFCRTGRLNGLGKEGWDACPELARLELPILGLSMAGDTYAPQASTERLAAMTAAPFRLERVDRVDGHRPGHFRWLRHPAEPARRIAAFLNERGTAPKHLEGARGSARRA